MALTIKSSFQNNILHVHVTGEYSTESVKSTFAEMLDKLAEQQADKALIDCRQIINLTNDPMLTFNYSDFAAKELLERMMKQQQAFPRLAYIFTEENLPIVRFGETVGINRGLEVKVFTDKEEAILWLEAKQ